MTAPHPFLDRPHYYDSDVHGNVSGITFHLPTYRRFVPYPWLLYSEMNKEETQITLYYTHCIVSVKGRCLKSVHERIEKFELCWVSEGIPSNISDSDPAIFRIEISEVER